MQERLGRPIVVLTDPGMKKLGTALRQGLNRRKHPVWKRSRDGIVGTIRAQELAAVQSASVIVVLATSAFQRSRRGTCLMEAADGRRADVISLEDRTSGKAAPWSANVRIELQQPVDRLIMEVSKYIDWLEARVSQGSRGPTGRRGSYVVLSYCREDADLASSVSAHLETQGVSTWDYGDAIRTSGDYGSEIADVIKRSRALIVLLTPAWLGSLYCEQELEQAVKTERRCVWLRCSDAEPPLAANRLDVLDFRPRHRKDSLAQLVRAIRRARPTRRV